MAHKTFISYKYSEARNLRDRIINCLRNDATYYQGETSQSPNYSDRTTEYIKEKLKDMIYDSSVTIVILSPNMNQSNWIDWEISYSLKEMSRNGRTSKTNGIVAVVQKDIWGGYSWLYQTGFWGQKILNKNVISPLVTQNQDNLKSNYSGEQSYISIVTEDDFLKNPNYYLETAFEKCQNAWKYRITKEV